MEHMFQIPKKQVLKNHGSRIKLVDANVDENDRQGKFASN